MQNKKKKLIFVCSPYGGHDTNVVLARRAIRYVLDSGHVPIAPHVMYHGILDDATPAERLRGMASGIRLLDACDEMWIFPGTGITAGMQSEIRHAAETGIATKNMAGVLS